MPLKRMNPSYFLRFTHQHIYDCGSYVPWNLHEPEKGVYDFGQGNNDMSPFLDLVTFIKIAQEEDLFVLFRPGPYICSEWDFGGLPRFADFYDSIFENDSTHSFSAG
jgi:Glycosyl hydrolases family 35